MAILVAINSVVASVECFGGSWLFVCVVILETVHG